VIDKFLEVVVTAVVVVVFLMFLIWHIAALGDVPTTFHKEKPDVCSY